MHLRRSRLSRVCIVVFVLTACSSEAASAGCDDDVLVAVNQNGEYEGSAEVVVVRRDGSTDLVTGDWVATKPSFSPDGRQLVVVRAVGDYESSGPISTSLWIIGTDGAGRRRLTEEGLDDDPSWSPNGERIVFSEADPSIQYASRLATASVDGGDRRQLLPGAGAKDVAPAWSPDGRQIAFIRTGIEAAFEDASIWVVDADGTNAREIAQLPSARSVEWLPGGDSLLVSSFGPQGALASLVGVEDGSLETVARDVALAAVSADREIYYLAGGEGWGLVRARLVGDRVEGKKLVARPEIGFLYGYFGLSLNPCVQ